MFQIRNMGRLFLYDLNVFVILCKGEEEEVSQELLKRFRSNLMCEVVYM